MADSAMNAAHIMHDQYHGGVFRLCMDSPCRDLARRPIGPAPTHVYERSPMTPQLQLPPIPSINKASK